MSTLKEQVLLVLGNASVIDGDGVVVSAAKGLMKSVETINGKDISESLKASQVRGVFRDRFGTHLDWAGLQSLMTAGKWDVIVGHMRQADHARGVLSQRTKATETSMPKIADVFGTAFGAVAPKAETSPVVAAVEIPVEGI